MYRLNSILYRLIAPLKKVLHIGLLLLISSDTIVEGMQKSLQDFTGDFSSYSDCKIIVYITEDSKGTKMFSLEIHVSTPSAYARTNPLALFFSGGIVTC